jgi:hypothetical protein
MSYKKTATDSNMCSCKIYPCLKPNLSPTSYPWHKITIDLKRPILLITVINIPTLYARDGGNGGHGGNSTHGDGGHGGHGGNSNSGHGGNGGNGGDSQSGRGGNGGNGGDGLEGGGRGGSGGRGPAGNGRNGQDGKKR